MLRSAQLLDDDLFFPKWKLHQAGAHLAWGKSIGVVHTTVENLCAFMYIIDSDYDMLKHKANNSTDLYKYPNKKIATLSDHSLLYYTCRKMPFPLKPREFLVKGIWKRISPDIYMAVFVPLDWDNAPMVSERAKRASLVEDEPASEASSKRSELVASSVGVADSLRSQLASLASLDEDEHTRDEVREMATDIILLLHPL